MTLNLIQPLNLTCEAVGYPPPTYQWYKDGEPIPGAKLPYLYVPEASPEDRGSYTCVASNDQDVEESSPGLVIIPGMSTSIISSNV